MVQLRTSATSDAVPSLNLADADDLPNSNDDPYLGTSKKVDHKG